MKTLAFAFLFLFAGCAREKGDPIVGVQEALFRYQFEHIAFYVEPTDKFYFLAFGDLEKNNAIDPPAEFLTHFPAMKSRIALFSEARRTAQDRLVIDKKTKEYGIIFFVGHVRMTGPDTAEAKGGFYAGGFSASTSTYRLKFGWRGWRVVNERVDSIAKILPNPALQPSPASVTTAAEQPSRHPGRG